MESIYYMIAASAATALLGFLGLKKKGRIGKGFKVMREAAELLMVVTDAVEDDKVTAAETKRIAKEAREVAAAFKALKG